MSALSGDGRDELVAAMEVRLALDTARITLEFDSTSEADRATIAALYRLGRILRHVSSDHRVSIEAELPRRMLDRFQPEAEAAP